MKRTIATILLITSSAWAVAPAHAMRCSATSCGGVVFPTSMPWYASLLGLVLSE
jgi:hypothetical protein